MEAKTYPACYAYALGKVIDLYGAEYVRLHKGKMIGGWSIDKEAGVAHCYFLFEGKERKDLVPNYKGWTVYAYIDVGMVTNEATVVSCVLPDGAVIRK